MSYYLSQLGAPWRRISRDQYDGYRLWMAVCPARAGKMGTRLLRLDGSLTYAQELQS